MLMFCDPADCYGPHCLERGFRMGRSKERHSSRPKELVDLCSPSSPGTHTSFRWEGNFQSCTGGSSNTTLGTCGRGSSRPGAMSPASVTCPCVPEPGAQTSPDTWVTQGTAGHTHWVSSDTLNFQIQFWKIPFLTSGMWLWFWKTAPQNSKTGTLCSGTCQSYNYFFPNNYSSHSTRQISRKGHWCVLPLQKGCLFFSIGI